MKLFITWNGILKKYTELAGRLEYLDHEEEVAISDFFERIVPVLDEIEALRKQLPTSTAKERIKLEARIDAMNEEIEKPYEASEKWQKDIKDRKRKLYEDFEKTLSKREMEVADRYIWWMA